MTSLKIEKYGSSQQLDRIEIYTEHEMYGKDHVGGEMSNWRFFSREEMACKHCGRCEMDDEFMELLDALRESVGFPLVVNSGYRCPEHNAAVSSTGRNGPHTTGKAVDLRASGKQAHEVLLCAAQIGFPGIGVSQKGAHGSRFIHIDNLTGPTRPWVWSY